MQEIPKGVGAVSAPEKINNCPFCGGEAELTHGMRLKGGCYSEISCLTSGCFSMQKVASIRFGLDFCVEKVLKKWNSRRDLVGWRTIESAPKDGARILLNDSQEGIVIAYYSIKKEWIISDCADPYYREEAFCPSHWMPLPEPPRSE